MNSGTAPTGATLLIGSNSNSAYGLWLTGSLTSNDGTGQYGLYANQTLSSTVPLNSMYSMNINPTFNLSASSTNIYGCYINNRITGNSSTYSSIYGLYIDQGRVTGVTGTNAYSLFVNNPNYATNNYCAYFGGNVGINNTAPIYPLDIVGTNTVFSITSQTGVEIGLGRTEIETRIGIDATGTSYIRMSTGANMIIGSSEGVATISINQYGIGIGSDPPSSTGIVFQNFTSTVTSGILPKSVLNYYEILTNNNVLFGTIDGSTGSVSVKYCRLGALITMLISELLLTIGATTSTIYTSTSAIQDRFLPAQTESFPAIVAVNNSYQSTPGKITLTTAGQIIVALDCNGSGFPAGSANCGLIDGSYVSYTFSLS